MNTPRKPNLFLILLLVMAIPVAALLVLISAQRGESPEDVVFLPAGGEGVYRGAVYDPPQPIDDFALPASTGETLRFSDFRGQWVLLFFGFTHCPDVCPTTLLEYREVVQQLGDAADGLQVLFISVDGRRDTPDVLAGYVARFNPTFIAMQGDADTLAEIQPQFGLWYSFTGDTSGTTYGVDHSARTYLIDPDGQLRMSYSFGTETNVLTETIREMMAQG